MGNIWSSHISVIINQKLKNTLSLLLLNFYQINLDVVVLELDKIVTLLNKMYPERLNYPIVLRGKLY